MAKSAAVLKQVPKEKSLGELIDELEELRRERKPFYDKAKHLKDDYDEVKGKIIALLDAQQSLKGASAKASVSISETPVPVVKDIEQLLRWIVKNKAWHLVLAQPLTTPAWREAVEKKGSDLPGTETFVKRDLNHSSLK